MTIVALDTIIVFFSLLMSYIDITNKCGYRNPNTSLISFSSEKALHE